MATGQPRTTTLTRRGARYAELSSLDDGTLHCLGDVYARLGVIERRPGYLYDRSAVVAAIVAAEQGSPVLSLVEGRRG